MIELHAHTTASDGLLTPRALVTLAASRGVLELAITDHDTTAAFDEASVAAQRLGVTLIGGIEASAVVGREQVHLLGLGIDPQHPSILAMTERYARLRQSRARAMVERLGELGIRIEWADVRARADVMVTRPHVASALVDSGHAVDLPDAFERYLGDDGPAYVPLGSAPATEWIEAIHRAGGIAMLAHPGHWAAHRTVMALVGMGLDGFEAIHPSHDTSLVVYYQELADRLGLLTCGGSDFHGRNDLEADRLGTLAPTGGRLERLRARILPSGTNSRSNE